MGDSEVLRVGLYARVSTADKHQDPEVQLRELREYALERNWHITEYIDVASGVKEQRVEFQRLMQDAKAGKIDVVLTWKMDRFSRSLRHLLNTLNELQELGVMFVSLKENLDFTTPTGKLLSHILGAFAQFERDIISQRVKAGIANARSKGKRIGREAKTPFDASNIISMHQTGLSDRGIAKNLNLPVSTVYNITAKYKNGNNGSDIRVLKPIKNGGKSCVSSNI